MKKAEEKTNAIRLLEQRRIAFKSHNYLQSGAVSGPEVARALGQNPSRMFKTLVTEGRSGAHYVFLVPVNRELNLKNAASAVGEKSIVMIKSKELLPLTGYIHGGCSPIGMKKPFPTFIHESALLYDYIYISAGKRGLQIKINPQALIDFVKMGIYPL